MIQMIVKSQVDQRVALRSLMILLLSIRDNTKLHFTRGNVKVNQFLKNNKTEFEIRETKTANLAGNRAHYSKLEESDEYNTCDNSMIVESPIKSGGKSLIHASAKKQRTIGSS